MKTLLIFLRAVLLGLLLVLLPGLAAADEQQHRFFDVLALYEFRDGPVIPADQFPSELIGTESPSDDGLRLALTSTRFDYIQDQHLPGGQIEWGPLPHLSVAAGGFYSGKSAKGSGSGVRFEFHHRYDLFGDVRIYASPDHRGVYGGLGATYSDAYLQLAYIDSLGNSRSTTVKLNTGGAYGIIGLRVPVRRARLNLAVLHYPQVRMTTLRLGLGVGW